MNLKQGYYKGVYHNLCHKASVYSYTKYAPMTETGNDDVQQGCIGQEESRFKAGIMTHIQEIVVLSTYPSFKLQMNHIHRTKKIWRRLFLLELAAINFEPPYSSSYLSALIIYNSNIPVDMLNLPIRSIKSRP